MKYLRKIMAVLCCMTLALSLMACGNKTEESKDTGANQISASVEQDTTEITTTPIAVTEEVTEYPVTITDSEGTEITFDAEPMKVISVGPNITEMLYQLGIENKLVGRTDYCDYPEEVTKVASIGTLREPDIEKIISLKPDVVIASTHFNEEAGQKLSDLGVKVVVLYEEYDIKGVYTMLEIMGTIFNIKEAAATAVNEMKKSIADTEIKIKDLETPSVYYVVGYGEYGDYTSGGDTFVGQLLTLAGGNNIAQEVSGWSYTLESLVEADPDIIILSEDMKNDFIIAENYKDLSAVKNGKVYGIDRNLIERQGYRNAQGLRTLAEIMHPEAFQ